MKYMWIILILCVIMLFLTPKHETETFQKFYEFNDTRSNVDNLNYCIKKAHEDCNNCIVTFSGEGLVCEEGVCTC